LTHALALLAFELQAERSDRTMRDVARPSVLYSLTHGSLSLQQARTSAAFVNATGQSLRVGFVSTTDDVAASQPAHRLNGMPNENCCLAAAPDKDGVLFLVEDSIPEQLRATLARALEHAGAGDRPAGLSDHFSDMSCAAAALEQARMVCNIAS